MRAGVRRQNNLFLTMFAFIFTLLAVKFVESIPVKCDELTASYGKHVTIDCNIENQENNVIIWKHGGRVLFAGDIRVRHDARITATKDKLVISNVQSSDRGLYKCEIETMRGYLQNQSSI